jgi:hypothetical protein
MQFGLSAFAELPIAGSVDRDKSIEQLIKEAATTTLTGLTTTGNNIFVSRVHNLEQIKLPALLLYTKDTESEPIVMHSARTIEKTISLEIQGYVKQNTNYDDKIDDISQEVEEALYGNRLLNNLAKDSFLNETLIEYESTGDNPLARVVMDFQVVYHHNEGSL